MKAGAAGVLPHNPSVGVANFFDRRSSQGDNLGIPARGICVTALHAFAELHERVLDVAWVLLIVEVFAELFVRELTAEPRIPPKEAGHEYDEPSHQEKKKTSARGHAMDARGWRSCVAWRRIWRLRIVRWGRHVCW